MQSRTGGAVSGYLYDAEGTRVAKGTRTVWNCDNSGNNLTITTSYILGPGSEQLTELTWNGSTPRPAHTNVWAGGQLAATFSNSDPDDEAAGVIYFHLSDWLGTRRMLTDAAGNVAEICHSLPYGNGEDCVPPAATEHLFTGKERDTESGNDYFGARYYASSMGRFMSPDPLGFLVADGTNPQSWNFYSYALNNPLRFIDPTGYNYCQWSNSGGHEDRDDDYTGNASIDQGAASQDDCGKQGGTWIYDDNGGPLATFSGNSNHPGDDGGKSPDESTVSKIADCAVEAGKTLSISNGLAHIPGAGKYLKDGTWGRTAADALGGGNPFTGVLDAGKTLFGNPANAKAIEQTAAGMAAAGPLQGFGALAPKGSTGGLSVAPDLVGKTAEVGVKAGAKLLGATAEVGEEAASGVGVAVLGGYFALTVGEGLYCTVTNF